MRKQPVNVEIISNGRRAFLGRTLAVVAAAALVTGCTVTTTNGVTTITIDINKVVAYGDAGISAVTTVLSVAAIASAIGTPAVTTLNLAAAATQASLTALKNKAGSTVTLTYDSADFKSEIDSVLTDIKTISSTLGTAITGATTEVSSSALSSANTALNALNTVIAVFEGILGLSSSRSTSPLPMTIGEALAVLNVKNPG